MAFAVAGRRSRRRAYLVLALACFFGAGEELAWGQHALGFSVPDPVAGWNAQSETTLHNLDPVQRLRHTVRFDPIFALAYALALGYLVLAPLAAARSARAQTAADRVLPVPPAAFGAVLLLNLMQLALAGALAPGRYAHAVAEVAEAGLAFVLLGVAIDAARRTPTSGRRADP